MTLAKLREMGRKDPVLLDLAGRMEGDRFARITFGGTLEELAKRLPLELWVGFSNIGGDTYAVSDVEFPGSIRGRRRFKVWSDRDISELEGLADTGHNLRMTLQAILDQVRSGEDWPNVIRTYMTQEDYDKAYYMFITRLPPTLMVSRRGSLELFVQPWATDLEGVRGRALVGKQRVSDYVTQAVAKWRSDNGEVRSPSEWASVARDIVREGIEDIKQKADMGDEEPSFVKMPSEVF